MMMESTFHYCNQKILPAVIIFKLLQGYESIKNKSTRGTMTKDLVFITVIGKDQKGIIARISNAVFAHNINIEDLNQKIMGGYFVMTMLADTTDSSITITQLKKELAAIEAEMGLKIQVQHENIFEAMHRV
jgi:ACT domain-containing protein